MGRITLAAGCVGFMLVMGCANPQTQPDDEPLLTETTLTRYDGNAITLEELESIRYSAIATADTIARIERELQEPWAEQRDARILIEQVSEKHPTDTRLALNLWETTEPSGPGRGRAAFREFGFYRNSIMPSSFGFTVNPATLEQFTQLILDSHGDTTPSEKLLAAWRRFSPTVVDRRATYLASSWQVTLDFVSPVEVRINESLLGPHWRSEIGDTGGVSFPGPVDSLEGYTTSAIILDLLVPGPTSPIASSVDALRKLATGEASVLPIRLTPGSTETPNREDRDFLQAALRGLDDGMADLESLPASTNSLSVTFSYLLENAEARSTLSFTRQGNEWTLTAFDYQPAAASLIGGDARLDLMPLIRGLAGSSRNQ